MVRCKWLHPPLFEDEGLWEKGSHSALDTLLIPVCLAQSLLSLPQVKTLSFLSVPLCGQCSIYKNEAVLVEQSAPSPQSKHACECKKSTHRCFTGQETWPAGSAERCSASLVIRLVIRQTQRKVRGLSIAPQRFQQRNGAVGSKKGKHGNDLFTGDRATDVSPCRKRFVLETQMRLSRFNGS